MTGVPFPDGYGVEKGCAPSKIFRSAIPENDGFFGAISYYSWLSHGEVGWLKQGRGSPLCLLSPLQADLSDVRHSSLRSYGQITL